MAWTEAQKKYAQSEKGKAARKHYMEKRRATKQVEKAKKQAEAKEALEVKVKQQPK